MGLHGPPGWQLRMFMGEVDKRCPGQRRVDCAQLPPTSHHRRPSQQLSDMPYHGAFMRVAEPLAEGGTTIFSFRQSTITGWKESSTSMKIPLRTPVVRDRDR